MSEPRTWGKWDTTSHLKTKIVNGEPATEIVVHRFLVSDDNTPEITAARPLYEWETSEAGQWVMEHAVEPPRWVRNLDISTWQAQFAVIARLKEGDLTYFLLRWGT